MNEIIETTATERTPELIAHEINAIKQIARRSNLQYAIEIGERLTEAKQIVPYGSWGEWLSSNVDYSTSTAANLMKLYREYGDKQISMTTETLTHALEGVDMTSALLLTALPADERAEFAEQNDIVNKSTREVEALIKAKKEADERAAKANERLEELRDELDANLHEQGELGVKVQELQNSLRDNAETIKDLEDQLSKAKKAAQAAEAAKSAASEKALAAAKKEGAEDQKKKGTAELEKLKKAADELKKKLDEAEYQKKAAAEQYEQKLAILRRAEEEAKAQADPDIVKFQTLLGQLQNDFNALLTVAACARSEETKDKLSQALKKVLEKLSAAV